MNKSTSKLTGILSLSALLLASTVTVACAQMSSQPTPVTGPVVLTVPGAAPQVTVLGESAAGQTVSVAQGSDVEIKLIENLSTGYHWSVRIKNGGVGYLSRSYAPGPAMPGAPGTAIFAFHAGMKGTTTFLFDYGRAAGVPAAETIEMSVEVK